MVPYFCPTIEADIRTSSDEDNPDVESDLSRMEVADSRLLSELSGESRRNFKSIEKALGLRIDMRGNLLLFSGPKEAQTAAYRLIEQFLDLLLAGHTLTRWEIAHAAKMVSRGDARDLREFMLDTILVTARRRSIVPRSPNQKAYVDAIRSHDIVFGVGPAGTGKTYLAVAMAVAALQAGSVRRIILTRPAVEAAAHGHRHTRQRRI